MVNFPQSLSIQEAMTHVQTLRSAREPALHSKLMALKRWQAQRFRKGYAEVLTHVRYGPAAQFFLNELYSDKDYSERDAQFSRIASHIERLFPRQVLHTAQALARLHALTEQLDDAMMRHLPPTQSTVNAQSYVQAWRALTHREARNQQLHAVLKIGQDLDRLTRTPGLRLMLKMMRKPASAAGLSSLQYFLEAGFDAFAEMKSVDTFLLLVQERESDWLQRLFDEPEADCIRHLQTLVD
jgi:hypothetical protein